MRLAGAGDAAVLMHRAWSVSSLARLATAFGRWQYAIRRGEAAVVRENLVPWAASGESADVVARRFFEERAVRRLLLALTPRLSMSEFEAHLDVRGREHLESVARAGRGGILLLSHLHSLGGFLAVIYLRKLGYDVRVALPTFRDPYSATRLRRLLWRTFGREETVPALLGGFPCQFNIRPIVRALEEGAIVAQTGDGWHSVSFVDAPFLGRVVPFPTGVISIARATGVPVLPAFATGPARRVTFVVEPPFLVGREPGALDRAVIAYAARLDAYVRARPETWEHWLIPRALDTLQAWRERPLRERYEVGDGRPRSTQDSTSRDTKTGGAESDGTWDRPQTGGSSSGAQSRHLRPH
jgi:lauroyl/myristoyl acyltransferase